MRLYEYEGKALLAQHGLQVPRGALWPEFPDVDGPVVAKAQTLGGKRGKQGGIRFADDREACRREVERLLGSRIDGHTVEQVYVEEKLDIDREVYLAILASREERAPLLLAVARGGMDVEDVPRKELLAVPISPLIGLRPYVGRHVASGLGLSGELARQAVAAVEGIYRAFDSSEAELVEINPLAITRDGRVVALDAKVVLNDQASFRHPERPKRPSDGTPFEQACAELGPIAIEIDPDGDVAAMVMGAGLMMATVDLLSAAGVRIRVAMDSAGTPTNHPERFAEVTRLVTRMNPKVIFVNGFMNLAFCDPIAKSVTAGLIGENYRGKVIVRLKGRNQDAARAILEPMGFTLVEDLSEAIQLVVAAVKEAR